MSRIVLFIGLICSVGLNVYFFLQLSVHTIKNNVLQEVSVHPQQHLESITKDKINVNATESSISAQHVVNKIKNAINAKDYFTASALINTLVHDHEAELPGVKQFWLQATKVLIQQDLFEQAENSISAYLTIQPDDGDFLYQQVDLYWQQQLLLPAIRYAYEVQYHVFNEVKKRDVVNFARELVQQQVDVLISNESWLELRELVEQVIILDPEYLNLQWLLVRAQYQLGKYVYARNAIEPLLNHPNYKVKAQALLTEIEAVLRKPENIPLSRQGEHFIVKALINDTFNVSLMLDTGASISLLSESAFESLSQYSEVVYINDLTLNTAGGQVTASIYQVAEFAIQGYTVNDFVFAVSPYVSEGNDGLLGMNFLRSFDFHIDQNNSRLILKNK
jgi:clan AA aspartic protease (TIGR02281 family)